MARRSTNAGRGQLSFTDALRGLQSLHDADDDGPGDDGGHDPDRPWTVSEACDRVNRALSDIEAGRPIRVEGEVGDCSIRDHWYFTLRDEHGAKLACSFFSQRRRASGGAPTPTVGMRVVATGRLEYWTKGGRLSLIVSKLEEAGLGDLHQRFERLKGDLEARGWFDPARRLPLPGFARSALVLTSASGAALHDLEETARRRWPGFRLLLAPIPVQGEAATPRIADAIRSARRRAPGLGVDAIVLTRGGGSLEDLWCFNEEAVAAAIVESREEAVRTHADGGPAPVPLVAAIGHEVDSSIAEFCADHRASTPTQAAMVLVPDAGEHREILDARLERIRLLTRRGLERAAGRLGLAAGHEVLRRPARLLDPHERRIAEASRRLRDTLRAHLEEGRRRLETAGIRHGAVSPATRLVAARESVDAAERRLTRAMASSLARRRERLGHLAARWRAVGPTEVLSRGYALVVDESGRPIRRSDEVAIGSRITATLAEGVLHATVDAREPDTDPA